jgi:uncharacterized protein (DUF488 family)
VTTNHVNISTIGFTQTTAESFFARLQIAKVRTVLDVRLNNTSQLAGFAKAKDLAFFLKNLSNISYIHQPLMAPTQPILDAYKKNKGDWSIYERQFMCLMTERRIEEKVKIETLEGACFLCSEAKPHHCHRRLVVDYLNSKWGSALRVKHL